MVDNKHEAEANKLLASDQFEPVGTDPIKVICQRFYRYKKHLGLDVNVKNARVRARAEVSCGRYGVIPCVVGGRKYVSCCSYSSSRAGDERGYIQGELT